MRGNARSKHQTAAIEITCPRCRSLELQLKLAQQENSRLRLKLAGYAARVRRHRFGRS